MTLTVCPESDCTAPAELVEERLTFGSPDGPVVQTRTLCLRGHDRQTPDGRGCE